MNSMNGTCTNFVMLVITPTNQTMSSFRDVPPFGRDTIRKFYRNVSDLKGFAARDYEDVLQVKSISQLADDLPTDFYSVYDTRA